jgi:apolipoprotein N-acyltransferase
MLIQVFGTRIAPSSLFWLFLGALCYYVALPPLNIPVFAFAVPICWGIVIRKERGGVSPPVSPTIRWYWVYLAANLFWLASIWWIACPHPLTALGLLAMSAYLSLYWVFFFMSARVAVHRFHIPLLVAMPICWIGCEYLRCHVLGGFSFCALEHAFYRYPACIQLASIGGSMLVGGAIMFIGAACLSAFFALPLRSLRLNSFTAKDAKKAQSSQFFKPGYFINIVPFLALAFFILPLFFVSFISFFVTLTRTVPSNDGVGYSIVALQGNRQIYIDSAPEEVVKTTQQFIDLTTQCVDDLKQKGESLPDLIVFPETVCHVPVLLFKGTVKPADFGLTEEEATEWERQFRGFVQQIETPVIFGLSTYIYKDDPDKPIRLNSALLVEPQRGDKPGNIYRYDKMHLVMFGEYIPFAEYLPDDFILRTLCPEAEHGKKPVAFPIGQGREDGKTVEASVNICFESSVSHLIRNQILTLRKEGHDPRVLINLSNDGWFRFSHEIEQHLATHVFRAVENRMWYVAATNGGYSAIISPYGTIVHVGKRGGAEAIVGLIDISQSEMHELTFYQRYGDWYALPFAIGVLVLTGIAFRERRKGRGGEKR